VRVEVCPQCGAPASPGARKCEYCRAEFYVSSLSYLNRFDQEALNKFVRHYRRGAEASAPDPEALLGLGLCYLQLRNFDLAIKNLGAAVDAGPCNGDTYYYYALALIRGRRPAALSLTEVRQIEEYLNTAIQLDPTKARYFYLAAVLKYDFYLANSLRNSGPSWQECLAEASVRQPEPEETERLLSCLILRDEEFIAVIRSGATIDKPARGDG
jgi:tetratricopeptide (TPR) repeat protein